MGQTSHNIEFFVVIDFQFMFLNFESLKIMECQIMQHYQLIVLLRVMHELMSQCALVYVLNIFIICLVCEVSDYFI